MSSKSSQGKKISFKPKVRAMEEIQKEYQQLLLQSGQAQYQVYVHSFELSNLQKRMKDINFEAAERIELDKKDAAAKEAETTKETTEEKT